LRFSESDALLEAERSKLLMFLQQSCPAPTLGAASEFLTSVETALTEAVGSSLRHILDTKSHLGLSGLSGHLTDSDGVHYVLSSAPDPGAPATFIVSLIPISPQGPLDLVRRRRKVRRSGRYSDAVVILPDRVKESASLCADAVQLLLITGYAWAVSQILMIASRAETEIGIHLYRLLHKVVPEDPLASRVWFATIGPAYGFRLCDPQATTAALEVIQQNLLGAPISPLAILASLLETRLPRQRTLMQKAAAQHRCIEVDVSDTDYARDGDFYAYVLKMLYGGTALTIMPLSVTDAVSVFALYPTGEGVISRRLEAHRDDFERLATAHADEIVKAIDLFEVADERSIDSSTDLHGGLSMLWQAVDEVALMKQARRGGVWRMRQRSGSS